MANNDLTKWQLLLSQLDLNLECFCGSNYLKYPHPVSTLNESELEDFVSQQGLIWPKGCLPTLTEAELRDFESQADFILPQGYREFCQVLGAGGFGLRNFFINYPDIDDIEQDLDENKALLESCKDSSLWSNEVKELLDNAYLFGGGGGLIAFVFDLRTYSEQDRSYDIYGIKCDDNFTCHLGRNFFEFIRDICIGDRAQKEFPQLLYGVPSGIDKDDPRYQSTTFILYPIESRFPDEELEEGEIEEEEEDEDFETDYWLT